MKNNKKLYMRLNFLYIFLVGFISCIILTIISEELNPEVVLGISILGSLCYIAIYFGIDFSIPLSDYLFGIIKSSVIFIAIFSVGFISQSLGVFFFFLSPLIFYFTFKKLRKVNFSEVEKERAVVREEYVEHVERVEHVNHAEETNQQIISKLDSEYLPSIQQLEDDVKNFSATLTDSLLYQEEYAHGTESDNQVLAENKIYHINNGKPTPYSLKFIIEENNAVQYTFVNELSKNNDEALQYLEEIQADLETTHDELIAIMDKFSNYDRSAFLEEILPPRIDKFYNKKYNPLTQITNSKVIDMMNSNFGGMKLQIDNFRWNYSLLMNYYEEYRKNYNIIKLGLDGEDRVNSELKKWTGFIDNLSNINLQYGDWRFECDNIILSTYGIFVLEVKNIGANGKMVLQQEENGRWHKIHVNNKGKRNDEIMQKSPCAQNDEHVAYLNQFLREKLNKNITNIFGIVVIANNNVELDIKGRGQAVVREYKIMDEIRYQHNPNALTQEELEQIKKVILEHNMPSKKYKMKPYADILLSNEKELLKQGNKLLEQLSLIQLVEEAYLIDLKLKCVSKN